MRTSARPWPRMQIRTERNGEKQKQKKKTDEGQVPDRRGCIKQKSQVKHTNIAEMTSSQRQTFAYSGPSPRILVNLQIRGKERLVDK